MPFSILFFLLSSVAFAEPVRHMMMIGGGGEPSANSTTIFDESFEGMGNYLSNNKWSSDVLFNGGHSNSENILDTKFSTSHRRAPFTSKNYADLIASYIAKINTGEIMPGEQLLIYIDSHGAEKSGNGGDLTHNISIGSAVGTLDLNKLSGSDLVSLDSLKQLQALAEAKGIKLAILDMSCHSGNTLALADAKTCVISSTGPNHYGYSNYSSFFILNMASGKSLEDVFLKTRNQIAEPAFPMISSYAGNTIFHSLYPALTPFLFYHGDNHADKLTPFLLKSAETCHLTITSDSQLFTQIQLLQDQLGTLVDTSALKTLIEEYKASQENALRALNAMGASERTQKTTFSKMVVLGSKRENVHLDYSLAELMSINFDSPITYFTRQAESSKGFDAAVYSAQVELSTQAKAKQAELRLQNPDLADYENRSHKLIAQMNDTYDIASKIAVEENKLYQQLYGDLSKQDRGPNACKDFVL